MKPHLKKLNEHLIATTSDATRKLDMAFYAQKPAIWRELNNMPRASLVTELLDAIEGCLADKLEFSP
jgi:hypothetical protein